MRIIVNLLIIMTLSKKDLDEMIQHAMDYQKSDNINETDENNKSMIYGMIPDMIDFMPDYNNQYFIESIMKSIDEGLIKTYDIEATKRFVCQQCKLNPNQFYYENRLNNGVVEPIVSIYLSPTTTKSLYDLVVNKMDACGYNVATYPQRGSYGEFIAVFEPKFGNDITKQIKANYRYLYHITPTVYVNKIKRNGLCPMSRNQIFLYPNRVYATPGKKLTDAQKSLYKNLQKVRAKDDKFKNEKNNDDNTYTLLIIDTRKLPDSIVFRSDSIADNSFYTYGNIPPDAIVSYKNYYNSFDDFKKHLKRIVKQVIKEITEKDGKEIDNQ